jgi:replicative DNA helicase
MSDNRLFQLDSEVAVISLLFRLPDLVHSISGLRHLMFSSLPHQFIFQEIEELQERQLVPDPTLIIAGLESKNLLDKAGGKKYIEFILTRDFNESTFAEHVRLVMDSYKARTFISVISSTKKDELTTANIDEHIYNTKKSLENLMEVGGTPSIVHLGDIVKSVYEEIAARKENPGIRGSSWGIESLDKATGGKSAGDLWVIAGRPGMGKTAQVVNSMLADGKNGVPCLLIEREMRNQQLTERLISIDTGIPNNNIRLGILNTEQMQKIYDSLAKIKTYPIYMDTSYHSSDPYYVESTVNKYKNKYGVEIVYLDYIQLLTERDEGQTQEIGRLTRLFKLLSNDLNICSVLLSQLNRNLESRDDKRPLLSDMRQSGSIEEDADFVLGLYRDEAYNKETKYKGIIENIVLKNRNGPIGTVSLKFDGPTNRISEA